MAHKAPWVMDVGRACDIHNSKDHEEFRQALTDKLNTEFNQFPKTDTLIISSEHFHSRLSTAEMILNLKLFLEPWVERFEVIVYFRRQDELAVSYYSTRIKSGAPLSALIMPASGPDRRYFDFNWIFSVWEEVFGGGSVKARIYHNEKVGSFGILEDFCAICGIDLNGLRMPPWLNVSVNAEGLGLIHAAHQRFKLNEGGGRSDLLDRFIQDISVEYAGKYFPVGRQDAMDFYGQFIEENECLRQRAFSGRVKPLFDGDFSHYPLNADALPDAPPQLLYKKIQESEERLRHESSRVSLPRIRRAILRRIARWS